MTVWHPHEVSACKHNSGTTRKHTWNIYHKGDEIVQIVMLQYTCLTLPGPSMCANCLNKDVWKTKCTTPRYLWYILAPDKVTLSQANKVLDTIRCSVVADIQLDKNMLEMYRSKLPEYTKERFMNTKIKNMQLDIYRNIVAAREYATDDAIFVNQYKAEIDTGSTSTDAPAMTSEREDGQYDLLTDDIFSLLQSTGNVLETSQSRRFA